MISIGILTTLEEPMLPFYYNIIKKYTNVNFIFYFAHKSQERVLRDKELFLKRTGMTFYNDKQNINNISNFFKNVNYPIYSYESHNSSLLLNDIKKEKIEYLYNANSPNKLNIPILNATKGVFNIHPGQLPYYQGCTCVEWALYNNDPVALTSHFMNESYDAGPIIKIHYPSLKQCKSYQEVRSVTYKDTLLLFKNLIALCQKEEPINSTEQSKDDMKYYKVIGKEKLNNIQNKLKNNLYQFNKENNY